MLKTSNISKKGCDFIVEDVVFNPEWSRYFAPVYSVNNKCRDETDGLMK